MKWTTKGEDGKLETICMELSLPQFYKFLHEMEKAKTSMEMLAWFIGTNTNILSQEYPKKMLSV